MKDSKLTPRIGQTAKLLWAVYAGLTALCIVCLKFAGMNWFTDTAAEQEWLTALGVDFVQSNSLSPPVSIETLSKSPAAKA
jgi:hypothetical protein